MRAWILSRGVGFQFVFIVGATVVLAFVSASLSSRLFEVHQLENNTGLSAAVYQVLGTVYAILLTFTLWGVWQNFNVANTAVQEESYALVDLVHTVEASSNWHDVSIRKAAQDYANLVIHTEWPTLKNINDDFINLNEKTHSSSLNIIKVVQSITPKDTRETAVFGQTLTLLNHWLDARRTRILIAKGNSASALWPLLIAGALVLFAFHGLFVAHSIPIWSALLFGFSLVIGLTFYLIFNLDSPFSGGLSIDSEPFQLAVNILKKN